MALNFYEYIGTKQPETIITIHNHADNRGYSYVDINTYVTNKALFGNIVACHNGGWHYVERCIKGFETGTSFTDAELFEDILDDLRSRLRSGKIVVFSRMKEELCCTRMAETYFERYEVEK